MSKVGIYMPHDVGIIDNDYRGEIMVPVLSTSQHGANINVGSRVAQLILLPQRDVAMFEVEELEDTDRGNGGFGSTT